MMWCTTGCTLLILTILPGFGMCINRPVYKVVLAQKGFAQFLQYDVETPPLREFTFCIWIRLYELLNDQTIFTYVANSNNRIVRLWLDSGGHNMKISINGKITSSTPVEIIKDVWRHVCLSYQSNYGAWALYIDARLVSCEASQNIFGFILPGGGSVIIGYGTADNGAANGFEGEVFGANMILTSTIEKNFTAKQDPFYDQKTFQRNKLKDTNNNNQYIILSDLKTDEIHNNFEKIEFPGVINKTRSFIQFRTPHSSIEHNVGTDLAKTSNSGRNGISSKENDFLGFTVSDKIFEDNIDKTVYWSVPNDTENNKRFKTPPKSTMNPRIGTKEFFTISEFETPPPIGPPSQAYLEKSLEFDKIPVTESIYNIKEVSKKYLSQTITDNISEMETPPPLDKNTKVYGQWTSSKFAGNVLNYLKSINYKNRDQRKVPATIPLSITSDSFPYASDFKTSKVRTPNFQRRNLIEKFDNNKKIPQINIQILEDDLRSNILKSHAQAKPKLVKIVNRGEPKKKMVKRFYRNINSQESIENSESTEELYNPKPFSIPNNMKKKMKNPNLDIQNKNLMSILPFLKSLEYFVDNAQQTENNDATSTKSLPSGNKWHNVKSYSNDYTPRKINLQSENKHSHTDYKLPEANKKHPSVKLKYKYEDHKLVVNNQDERILKGRELAMNVSTQSDFNKDSVSIFKYNHGYLPGHGKKNKKSNRVTSNLKSSSKQNRFNKNSFNEQVKIGNALNERHVIGVNEEQNIQSFVGDESIPDINRYRSDIDSDNTNVPPSLGPRECKNVELYDRVLYVQPDESIDMTHILSPVRAKNIGIEFILQNYKKCSLAESTLENNVMLFIDWSKTPVRLFGGAYPITTTDLCGFFK